MGKKQTRKDFLTNTSKYAIGAVAGVAGLNALAGGKILANSNNATWPYAYQTIDPEVARQNTHTLYWNDKDCCAGVFGGIAQTLAAAMGDPWTDFPIEVMLFGRGGGVSWGSICGALNGAAALISLVVEKDPSTALINEVWGWYCSEELPTDAANAATYTTQNYVGNLAQNISGSPLCHASVSQWCNVADKKVGDVERKERCARLAGDIAAKTVEVLNAYFANTFTGTFADSSTVAGCLACHGSSSSIVGNVMTHMECSSCHPGDPHESTAVESRAGVPNNFNISQNYPNPFNPSTKIQFSVPSTERVRLDVYDIQGQLVTSLINSEVMNAGNYSVTWDGRSATGSRVASGIYFARLTSSNFMKTIKMNLMK